MTGAITAVVTAVITAASAVHQGEQARRQAGRAERAQHAAQKTSVLAAAGAERTSRMEENKANRKKPNLSSLMFGERNAAGAGPSSTILSGNSGGVPSMLGSKSNLGG